MKALPLPLLPVVALSLLALAACDVTPSEVVGAPIVFAGTIAADGGMDHYFVVSTGGGVGIEVTSLVADPPLADGVNPSIGIGLGQRDLQDRCQLTYSASVVSGFRISFGLAEEEYCVRVFDNTSIADDATRTYELRITPSE